MDSASIDVLAPSDCVQSQGLTCAQLGGAAQASVGMYGIQSISCTGTSSCTCTVKVQGSLADGPGTYTISGTSMTMTDSSGNGTDLGFCVKGSELHFITSLEDFVYVKH